jgi:hypothetical protein
MPLASCRRLIRLWLGRTHGENSVFTLRATPGVPDCGKLFKNKKNGDAEASPPFETDV